MQAQLRDVVNLLTFVFGDVSAWDVTLSLDGCHDLLDACVDPAKSRGDIESLARGVRTVPLLSSTRERLSRLLCSFEDTDGVEHSGTCSLAPLTLGLYPSPTWGLY